MPEGWEDDIFNLQKLQYENIEFAALKAAVDATTEKCGSKEIVKNYHIIMNGVKESEIMKKQIIKIQVYSYWGRVSLV